jgi:hypothetical protein
LSIVCVVSASSNSVIIVVIVVVVVIVVIVGIVFVVIQAQFIVFFLVRIQHIEEGIVVGREKSASTILTVIDVERVKKHCGPCMHYWCGGYRGGGSGSCGRRNRGGSS